MTERIITDSNGRKHITNEPQLHPPRRKPLTDEEIYKIANDLFYGNGPCDTLAMCRAIEAAHDIKENT